MTRTTILLASVVLAAASAGHAQLLGGGGAVGGMVGGGLGGIGGGIGGGLSGGVGGVGGSLGGVDGSLRGSLHSQELRDAARADRLHARELRAQAKERKARIAPASGATAVVAGGASTSATGAPGQPVLAAGGGLVARQPVPGGDGVDRLPHPSFAVRAAAEAERRGLRRIGRSVAGVAVYVPAVAVAGVAPASGGYVDGGGFYDVDYGGPVAAASPPVDDRQYEELRRDTAGTGVTVERHGADLVMALPADVTFAFDRADIQPRFVPALDAVARTIVAFPDSDIEVIGHTDAVGSDAYNFALSQRRGASVADFLVDRRIDPARLIVEGLGKTEPVASNATIAGRSANRRVEIILHRQTA